MLATPAVESVPDAVKVSLPVSATVSEAGSSSKVPALPFGALASALPLKVRCCLPETSMLPPSPPLRPAIALALPLKRVSWSLHNTAARPNQSARSHQP